MKNDFLPTAEMAAINEKKCLIVGAGPGNPDFLSQTARNAVQNAPFICGASRLLDSLKKLIRPDSELHSEYKVEKIVALIETFAARQTDVDKINFNGSRQSAVEKSPAAPVILVSGDAGFYSLAESLVPALEESGWQTEIIPALSSVQYFAAKIKKSWKDWLLASAHGTEIDLGAELSKSEKCFFLTGGKVSPLSIARFLTDRGFGDALLTAGIRLSYPDEKIISATAAEFSEGDPALKEGLSVLLVERKIPDFPCGALPDSDFIRSSQFDGEKLVPMSKRFVRSAILSLLELKDGLTVWDVGAGTGAVSVDIARSAALSLYSVEEKPAAVELEKANRKKFSCVNMEIICGLAPASLENLPAPDRVFVGGSQGHLPGILDLVLEKNPACKIVISAVTQKTIDAAKAYAASKNLKLDETQIAVTGFNPVTLFLLQKSPCC